MRKTGILVIFVLFLNMAAYAQTTIDLEEARILALANSPSLKRYETSIRNSILSEQNQLYSMLPQVSAGYSASMRFLNTTTTPGTSDTKTEFINPFDNISGSINLSISQVLFQGGKSFIQKAILAIDTETVRNNALSEYYKVLSDVDSAYYAVLEANASYEAAQSSLQAANLALEIAEVRFNNGMINQIEYLRAQADKESRENLRNQRQRTLSQNMITLRDLIGITGTFTLMPVSFDPYEDVLVRLARISNEDADALYENLWDVIAVSNLSLANAALNSRKAELNYSTIVRDYAPTISLSLSSEILSYSSANGFSGPTANGSVSLRGTIPLDFWVLNNRVERGKISRDNTLNEYSNTERTQEQSLLNTLYSILTQAGQVLYSRRSLEISQSTYEYQMERYRLSQSSVKDVGDASISLIESQNSLNSASYSFLKNLSNLRTLCALDDEERLINILLGR